MKDSHSIDRHVGQRLRQLRLERGLDLLTLSRAVGIRKSRLLQLEDGHERVSSELMLQLSNILEVRPSEFFTEFATAETKGLRVVEPIGIDAEAQLLRDFARVKDEKSRTLILLLVAAYADSGDCERNVED